MKERNLAVMFLLGFITCGIYNLCWMYMSRDEFKNFSGNNSINPGLEILLCLLCFPYYYFWVYKACDDIAQFQAATGRPVTNNGVLCIVLTIFGLGWITPLIIQDQLNKL